ncbi:relaxase MobL, partial [Enterococcus faecium]
NLLNEVYKTLPDKRSEWNYGDEKRTKLSPYTREKLDELTKYVLTKEPEYQEYIQISKALKEEAKSLYGESKRESKDAEKNALFDLKKRTGNAILTELKRQDSQIKPLIESVDQMQSIYNERSFRTLKQLPTNEYKYSYEEFMKRRKQFQQRVVTQRSLRQLNRTINAHEEKYHASKAYEEQQRRIQMEQERQ